MLTAVSGYYNGKEIILDEHIHLTEGQKVIITILEPVTPKEKNIDLSHYMGRGNKMFVSEDAEDYVKGLRLNDRI